MENRDNIIEEQLKNSVENIPDSLKPNNMEQRLLQMTQEERFSRSMSVDIPDDNETKRLAKSDKSKDKKSGKKKVIIPMAIAASVLLAAGVGAYFMFNRASSKSSDSSQGLLQRRGLSPRRWLPDRFPFSRAYRCSHPPHAWLLYAR